MYALGAKLQPAQVEDIFEALERVFAKAKRSVEQVGQSLTGEAHGWVVDCKMRACDGKSVDFEVYPAGEKKLGKLLRSKKAMKECFGYDPETKRRVERSSAPPTPKEPKAAPSASPSAKAAAAAAAASSPPRSAAKKSRIVESSPSPSPEPRLPPPNSKRQRVGKADFVESDESDDDVSDDDK